MNVLIVDDLPSNLKLLRAVLEAEGLAVYEAGDGIEALGLLRCIPVDAVVSDILMPRMDGYRLCMEVRADHQLCELPFIAYTATYTTEGDEKLMTDMGADRFLRKPASAAVLASTLEEVVLSKRRRPPGLGRMRSEAALLEDYHERLADKLGEKSAFLTAEMKLKQPVETGTADTNSKQQRVLDHCPVTIYGATLENKKIVLSILSGNIPERLGFTVVEALSYDWWLGQLHPDDRVAAVASIFETLARGRSRTEYRLRHKDGSILWVEDQRQSLRKEAGSPAEFSGVLTDITERKKREDILREDYARCRALITNSSALALEAENDGVALAGRDATRITAAESSDGTTERPSVVREAGALDFKSGGQSRLIALSREIRRRERAESRLVLQSAVTATLAEAAAVSKIHQRILGLLGQALPGAFGEWWTLDCAAKELRCIDSWHTPSTEFSGFAAIGATVALARGQDLPGRVWDSGRCEWWTTLFGNSLCRRHEEATKLGWHGWIGFPIRLRSEVVGVVGFFCRRLTQPDAGLLAFFETIGIQLGQFAERQELIQQFRQANKLEALGTLAGGIAHDFNNILVAIYGHCELAREAAVDPSLIEHLEGLMGGARRASALVQQILAFGRHELQERQPLQLWDITTEVLSLLRAAVPARIQFQTALAKDAPLVLADSTQIHQILMNLGINAAHAMRERGGCLTVTLESFHVDAALAATHADLHVGVYARLSVQDNGHGMDAATLGQIFEPFFTTKPCGEGTGLGLAVVHGIVKAHEGAITVSSQLGQGTIFRVYFPKYLGPAGAGPSTGTVAPQRATQRILFVDDEESLTALGEIVLTRAGYLVETCVTAEKALELVRADPAAYSLVITDQRMSGMTGTDLAHEIMALRADLPIILTTGDESTLLPDRLRAVGIRQLLVKPVAAQALIEAVRHVLTTSAAMIA